MHGTHWKCIGFAEMPYKETFKENVFKTQTQDSAKHTISAIQLLDIVTDGQHDNQELLLSHMT